MASYRLTDQALSDLDRLYEYGVVTFGLWRANEYYDGLIEHFQTLANLPLLYGAVDEIRTGYRRAFIERTRSTIASTMTASRSYGFWGARIVIRLLLTSARSVSRVFPFTTVRKLHKSQRSSRRNGKLASRSSTNS